MYECKQCKQKINKYYDEYSRSKDYNFILRILGCRNAGMQEIQKNELYAEKKGSRSPFAARAFFYFLFLISFFPVDFVIAATGSTCTETAKSYIDIIFHAVHIAQHTVYLNIHDVQLGYRRF